MMDNLNMFISMLLLITVCGFAYRWVWSRPEDAPSKSVPWVPLEVDEE